MSMRARGSWAIVVGSALVLSAQACSSDDPVTKAVSEGCLLPTDCTDPLACVFRRCHQQCLADRDCPSQQICSGALAPKKGICLFPEEITCARNSDCEYPLVCDRKGHCNQQCVTSADCLVSQVCAAGSCVDKEAAPPDGGVAPGKEGETCALASDCSAGLVCISGRCSVECREDRDCRTDEACLDGRCYKRATDAGVDGAVDATDATVDAPPGYGKACVYPSDCAYPLVCRASGVCGWECNLDPDCKSTETCKDHFCVVRPPDAGVDADAATDSGDAEVGKACVASADCDDGKWCNGPEQCVAGACAPAVEGPCTSHTACVIDVCDEATKKCTHTPTSGLDVDGDGHVAIGCGGDDCDDKDPTVYAGAPELCDGKDNNCDGKIDDYAVAPRGKAATLALSSGRDRVLLAPLGAGYVAVTNRAGAFEAYGLTFDAKATPSAEKKLGFAAMSLAGGGSHFLFVACEKGTNLSLELAKPDLSPITSVALPVVTECTSTDYATAWDGTRYVAAFARGGTIDFTFVQPDGTLVGGVRKLPNGAGGAGGYPVVAATSSLVLVAYQATGTSFPAVVLLSSSGSLVAGPIELASALGQPTAVLPTPGGFLVAVQQWSDGAPLYARTVSTTGVLGPYLALGSSAPASFASDGSSVAFASTGTDLTLQLLPKGLGGIVEMTVPFPTVGAAVPRALAAQPGPQLLLVALSSAAELRYQRIGCAP